MKLIQASLILLSGFPVLSTLLLGYQLLRNGQGALGKPTIVPWLFFLVKIIIGFLFAVLFTASIKPDFYLWFPGLIQNEIPLVQKLMCAIFLAAGNLFLIPAYYTLSIFTRVGLPASAHVLKTEGVYRISRNPMYMSFWFFFTACFLLVPSLLMALLIIFCLTVHHFIILNEEKFLTRTFPDTYPAYKQTVRRYYSLNFFSPSSRN
jgi:protein-S-isoprenylcysteine O-methyltransferase Ste14